ncbi:MAG: dehypoxanthine futalosine cyclase [Euryarchaeota archaeon]|nr:dehypoxanthine futalosine cyclase [Euryarchaeota archaeon]
MTSTTLLPPRGRLNREQESEDRTEEEVYELAVSAANGKRLTPEEALALYEQADLHLLGRAATKRKAVVKDDRYATYVIDRNVSYTNACNAYCTFCAFYRPPGDKDVWVWDIDTILKKVDELVEIGGTQVMLQGGLNPDLRLDYYETVFRAIKDRHPHVALHSLTATEVDFLARQEDTSHRAIIEALRKAGWDSLPGGGAEILVERVRKKVSPLKNTGQVWQDVHSLCHSLGIRTTATMTYGHMETNAERIEHLRIVRDMQDKAIEADTGGSFTAMIPWSMAPSGTKLEGRIEVATGQEYLRTQAICRLFLDNVDNLQAGWLTNGPKLAQLALDFGANDFGGILMEEQVVSATGLKPELSIGEIVSYIEQTGRIAAQRDTYYTHLKVHG